MVSAGRRNVAPGKRNTRTKPKLLTVKAKRHAFAVLEVSVA